MNKQVRINKNTAMDFKMQTKKGNQLESAEQALSTNPKQVDRYFIFNQAYHNHDKKTDFSRVINSSRTIS
jgi:hypothetical protein